MDSVITLNRSRKEGIGSRYEFLKDIPALFSNPLLNSCICDYILIDTICCCWVKMSQLIRQRVTLACLKRKPKPDSILGFEFFFWHLILCILYIVYCTTYYETKSDGLEGNETQKGNVTGNFVCFFFLQIIAVESNNRFRHDRYFKM